MTGVSDLDITNLRRDAMVARNTPLALLCSKALAGAEDARGRVTRIILAARAAAAGQVDHAKCGPSMHDRSLPDPPADQEVTRAADGLMGCADCRRPLFWCENDHQWHHVDPDAECWLTPAWGAP